MFAELIFVILAIGGLILIDNFSTSCALITCILVIYYYVDYFPFVFNKYTFVLVASKVWALLSNFYSIGKYVFSVFQRFFCIQSNSKCQSVSNNFCGNKADVENEMKILISKISHHYIRSWYDKISSNDEFVTYINSSINHTLHLLVSSISKVDKRKISYDVLQIYLNFLAHFVEAQKKAEVFKTENFKMKHWALKDKATEWCYSQSLVSTLLDSLGPIDSDRSLHSKSSPILHTVVVEILTENLIHPLVNLLCDPTRLNLLLLKVLLNYTQNLGDEKVPCSDKEEVLLEEQHVSNPIILLPDQILPDHYTESNPATSQTEKFLCVTNSVPCDSTLSTPQSVEDKNDKLATPLFSSGIKSTSNINISDHNFHSDSGMLDCDSYSPLPCDTIKRSKSADYIRQIQPKGANLQLKALSERDYDIRLQSKGNKMLVTLKPESSSHNSIEEAEEAVEFEGQTLFLDVKITDTFLQNEAGFIPYTLYNIQYTGVYHDTGISSEAPRLVKEETCVRKRFKEFVELHSKLEDNPLLKNYIKGIRGPSKWLVLPFSNLDKKNIADRKIFLENYLKELCSSIPIAQSYELHHFLNYRDKNLLYGRKTSDVPPPRIDKIFVRGVKSAIDMFKIAAPMEEDVFSAEPLMDENIPDLKFQEHLLDFCSREPDIDEHARNFLENTSFEPAFDDHSTEIDRKKLKSTHLKSVGCCRCPPLPENRFTEEKHPLANTLFELTAVAFNLNETNPADISTVMKLACFSMIKLLCSSSIERTLTNQLDGISEEHIAVVIHFLHKFLWPDESNSFQTRHSFEDGATLNKIMECFKVILSSERNTNKLNFGLNNILLEKANLFLSSVQHQETNKCLLYHAFDVIVENVLNSN